MPAPRVSIIVLNWNGGNVLPHTLPGVADTRYPALELVVADNGSSDGSPDWVEAGFPNVRVIRHPENWGFCRGNNEAILQTSGELVLLLNNDVEVTEGWLDPLVSRMMSDDRIGAVQPKLLQYKNRRRFEYAGASGGYIDSLGYPFTRGRLFETLEDDRGQYDDARPVFWATGAALLLRRSALEKVGLLDESFYLHMEEIDLCWRLARAGYLVYVEPASTVHHIGGSSLPRGHPNKTYYNFRNSLVMLYKNLPRRKWLLTYPVRVLLDGVALIRAFVAGAPGEWSAILRAHRDARKMFRDYRAASIGPPYSTVLPPYRGSIALDYFLLRRKTFGELPRSRFRSSDGVPGTVQKRS